MNDMTFRTQNANKVGECLRTAYWFYGTLLLLCVPVWILFMIYLGPNVPIFIFIFFFIGIGSWVLTPILVAYGYRHLCFVIQDGGLKVNFLRGVFIPWTEIGSIEVIDKPSLKLSVMNRSTFEIGDLMYGRFMFMEKTSVYVWLAGEAQALLLSTPTREHERGYIIAPERLEEFKAIVDARLKE